MALRNRHMKIAYVVTRADSVGGAQVHVLDLAAVLRSQGHDATVLLGGDGPVTNELERRGIPYCSIPHLAKPLNPSADCRAALEIWKALRSLRPDLVAAHTAKAGMLARWAAVMAGVPAVFTPHGWAISDRISTRQGRIFRMLERFSGRVSARIINVCEYERRLALQYKIASDVKLAVVHNGIPDISAELLARTDREPPRLVTIARFEEPKDHRTLLLALSRLMEYEWTIDLIGDGPLQPAIERKAAELGLSHRMKFLGACRNVAPLLAGAQLFVLSTRSEAFPYTVLEAMRAGLPVVSSDVGGIREAVTDGQTGMLVPARDPSALCECLQQLISNPRLRAIMGGAARRRFLEQFTLDKMVTKTIQIYQEVLSESRIVAPRTTASRRNRQIEIAIRQ